MLLFSETIGIISSAGLERIQEDWNITTNLIRSVIDSYNRDATECPLMTCLLYQNIKKINRI